MAWSRGWLDFDSEAAGLCGCAGAALAAVTVEGVEEMVSVAAGVETGVVGAVVAGEFATGCCVGVWATATLDEGTDDGEGVALDTGGACGAVEAAFKDACCG